MVYKTLTPNERRAKEMSIDLNEFLNNIKSFEQKESKNENPPEHKSCFELKKNDVIKGNCLEKLKDFPDECFDAIITDPPYELGFMNKKWDSSGIAYNVNLWKQCLRVLKSGGHLISFGGSRTYHRIACAIEDAGFEVRDMIEWIYNSGFPKSYDVGKAVDRIQGNEREIVGQSYSGIKKAFGKDGWGTGNDAVDVTRGKSEWEGFGTSLKPAHEPMVLARKPFTEKTTARQVLKNGCGALDIDGCRIPTGEILGRKGAGWEGKPSYVYASEYGSLKGDKFFNNSDLKEGRFPANLCVTDDALNDGIKAKGEIGNARRKLKEGKFGLFQLKRNSTETGLIDCGSKSRFFDVNLWAKKGGVLNIPKSSYGERNDGLDGLEYKQKWLNGDGGVGISRAEEITAKNIHPTVKPLSLMMWLVKLVSKEGDLVLDMFAGSGTTLIACRMLSRYFVGIEMEAEYIEIIKLRLKKHLEQRKLSEVVEVENGV